MNKQDLIKKIKSIDALSSDEKSELIELVNTQKRYGLVWEEKTEEVEEELREKLPVLVEVKDKFIKAKEQKQKAKQDDLFTESGETNENTAKEAPNHILIEGDNLHALTVLNYTHAGKIDVIYIDPPYNTGNNDFWYDDNFVNRDDSYRHSKWISFMNKRLRIAKRLLNEKWTCLYFN